MWIRESFESLVQCTNCNQFYRQYVEDQVIGCRQMSEDICPYCGHIAGKSMDVEYTNRKVEDK